MQRQTPAVRDRRSSLPTDGNAPTSIGKRRRTTSFVPDPPPAAIPNPPKLDVGGIPQRVIADFLGPSPAAAALPVQLLGPGFRNVIAAERTWDGSNDWTDADLRDMVTARLNLVTLEPQVDERLARLRDAKRLRHWKVTLSQHSMYAAALVAALKLHPETETVELTFASGHNRDLFPSPVHAGTVVLDALGDRVLFPNLTNLMVRGLVCVAKPPRYQALGASLVRTIRAHAGRLDVLRLEFNEVADTVLAALFAVEMPVLRLVRLIVAADAEGSLLRDYLGFWPWLMDRCPSVVRWDLGLHGVHRTPVHAILPPDERSDRDTRTFLRGTLHVDGETHFDQRFVDGLVMLPRCKHLEFDAPRWKADRGDVWYALVARATEKLTFRSAADPGALLRNVARGIHNMRRAAPPAEAARPLPYTTVHLAVSALAAVERRLLRLSDPVDRRFAGEALRGKALRVVLTGRSDHWEEVTPEAVIRALE
jgi:hypothetical protein